jgi:hypothetical protein
MPRTHHLPVVRLRLLFLAVVLSSTIVLALAASADLSQAATAALPTAGLSPPAAQLLSIRRAGHSEASRVRQAECAATGASKQRRARKACVVKKAKAKGTKPNASPRSPGTPPAPSSASAFAITGPPPVEAFAVPAAEPTPPAEFPGDSDKPPGEPPIEAPVAGKASTTTTLSSSPDPSIAGQAVTYTATVSAVAATGNITFEDAGTAIASCAGQSVSSGSATCTLPGYAEASTHSIVATYNGDSDHLGSTSSSLNQVVSRASTSTTLTSSVNPSIVRQPVTYTAKVSPAAATGTVSFDEAGTPIVGCTAQTISSATARCTRSSYAATGSHSITATYSGDGSHFASASPALGQAVDKEGATETATTLSSSLNPSTIGQAVAYTATVSAASATGAITFKDGGVAIPGCIEQAIISGAPTTCTVTYLAEGWHSIIAVYSGDSHYAGSTSPAYGETVHRKPTTVAVSSSLNPSTFGEAVTYTATVDSAAVTGTVEFQQSGVAVAGCAARTVSAGVATCVVSGQPAGWWSMTAIYSGDSHYADSTSPAYGETVHRKPTTTTLESSLNPSAVGQAVTYTGIVNSTAATGTVEFREEGTPISGCTAQPVSLGVATCTVPGYPSWSAYIITASYKGDSSYVASASAALTQTVNPPVESAAPFRLFSPTSFWNKELPANATLDPTSSAVVGAFNVEIAKEVADNKSPTLNTTSYSVPVYTVPADQPTVKVTLEDANKPLTLQAAWDAVPLPADAQPAVGSDKHLVVWQPSTDRLWEFWHLEESSSGWQAAAGGAMENVSSDSGAYGPGAWAGAASWWGASATSLSIAGGLITLEDLEKGQINHALAMALPDTRRGVFASPAERTDGADTEPLSLPEGAHLRLDPSLNLASLHLPKLTLMLAEAAQRYGIIVRDTAGNVALYAQDPTSTGTEPYGRGHGYFEGKSSQQILESFPWSYLQLLKMELHSES